MVCLFVLPASLDWLLAGLTSWPGGEIWCQVPFSSSCPKMSNCIQQQNLFISFFQTAVFFDYYLNFLLPLFILMLCIILYTRKLPPKLPSEAEGTPYQTPAPPIDSRLSSRSGYTRQTPYRQTDISQVAHSVRAPSVRAASVLSGSSGRHGGQGDFRKGFSKAHQGSTPRSHGSVSGGGSYRTGTVPSVSGSVTVSGSVIGRGRGRCQKPLLQIIHCNF